MFKGIGAGVPNTLEKSKGEMFQSVQAGVADLQLDRTIKKNEESKLNKIYPN